MIPDSNTSADSQIVCRPDKGDWIGIVILMALGLPLPLAASFSPFPSLSDKIACLLFCAFFCGLALYVATGTVLDRVTADSTGLTFCGVGRRTSIPWHKIQDFELRSRSSSKSKPVAYIKADDRWRSLPNGYVFYDELLERIAQEAKWSQSQTWELQELRDDGEWPKTFVYHDVSGWRLVGIYFILTFLYLSLILLQSATKGWGQFLANLNSSWVFLSPWQRVGLVVTTLLLCNAMPLVVLAQYPAVKTRRRYLDQKLTATPEGLAYWKNDIEIFVRWEEIESYYLEILPGNFQPSLYVVETRRARIEWVQGISNGKVLKTLVQHRAKNATTKTWCHQHGADEEVIGGSASFWKGGNIGVGPKIYHYRTRIARSMLFLFGGMAPCMLVPLFVGYFGNGRPVTVGDVATGVTMSAALAIGAILGTCAFFYSSLQCEEQGLRQNSIWGERFMAWNEVEKFTAYGLFNTLSGRGHKIRFGMVADLSGLFEEIEKRSGVERKPPKSAR